MSFDKRLALVYGGFEILLLISSIFMGKSWFFSSQVGFFGALLILFASFRSYKNRVLSKVEEAKLTLNNDEEDEIWGESNDSDLKAKFEAKSKEFRIKQEQNLEHEKDLSQEDENLSAKELLKREKRLSKKNIKFENLQTAFVPFRLIAYAFLVVGFLSLNRNGVFDITAFLLALGVMPIGALMYGVIVRGD
ncbi:hypothetical protein [Campylobacter sp.]|uniref:hypothetical protein n=1 Tax=Campylobacter sp. TaxID=205 RepID=UPI002704D759|nr:hypothetical protein [Campylobacter sp.]